MSDLLNIDHRRLLNQKPISTTSTVIVMSFLVLISDHLSKNLDSIIHGPPFKLRVYGLRTLLRISQQASLLETLDYVDICCLQGACIHDLRQVTQLLPTNKNVMNCLHCFWDTEAEAFGQVRVGMVLYDRLDASLCHWIPNDSRLWNAPRACSPDAVKDGFCQRFHDLIKRAQKKHCRVD